MQDFTTIKKLADSLDKQKKSNLHYTRLILFPVASRWQRVGDLIGSGFEPHTSRTRSEVLSGRWQYNIVFILLAFDFSTAAATADDINNLNKQIKKHYSWNWCVLWKYK